MDTALQYITSIRASVELTMEQKNTSLVNFKTICSRPTETIDYLFSISNSRWQVVEAETLRVLEQVMRRSIHEDGVDVVKNGVALLVSLNEQQSLLVTELVTPFIVPNSFYSEELTQAAKLAARDAVKPVVQTYKAGETIVPAGEIITPAGRHGGFSTI